LKKGGMTWFLYRKNPKLNRVKGGARGFENIQSLGLKNTYEAKRGRKSYLKKRFEGKPHKTFI
jgi:hypothetical protein